MATERKINTPNPELRMMLDRVQAFTEREMKTARDHRVRSLLVNLQRWVEDKNSYLDQFEMKL